MYAILVLVVLVVMFLAASIRILNEYERAVIFRLGRIITEIKKKAGLFQTLPFQFVHISLLSQNEQST
jgi:regulator of protease activity HflC (stomatin/prohibitin superfamily)